MNAITKTLLAGAALGALATAPAVAGNISTLHVTALHAGRVVNKTRLHEPGREALTYTFSIYGSVPYELDKKINLPGGFKWNSSGTTCSQPKEKLKVPKKSVYAKIGKYTETYSLGCASGPTVFYGITYKLVDSDGKGQTDHFVSSLIGLFQNNGTKYKGTMNLDYTVNIGA